MKDKQLRSLAQIGRYAIAVTIAGFVGCLPEKSDAEHMMLRADAQVETEFFKIVADYVQRTRGWPESAYTLQFNGRKGETIIFWVIYNDDDFSEPGGSGKSFAVVFNTSAKSIEKELYFQ